jgi:hypothetical protein
VNSRLYQASENQGPLREVSFGSLYEDCGLCHLSAMRGVPSNGYNSIPIILMGDASPFFPRSVVTSFAERNLLIVGVFGRSWRGGEGVFETRGWFQEFFESEAFTDCWIELILSSINFASCLLFICPVFP